jgi:hypothetical protein
MVLDISLVSNSCFHSCLLGGAPALVWIHYSCDSQAGYHIHIGQSGGHWPMAEKEGICAVRPKVGDCNKKALILGVSARDNSKQ